MEVKIGMVFLAFSLLCLLIGVIVFWYRSNKQRKELDRRVCRSENLIDYLIKYTHKPKFSIGDEVRVNRDDNYMFIDATGIIVNIQKPDFWNQKNYYTVYVNLNNQPLLDVEECYITLSQTHPAPSDSAHKSPAP